MNQFVTQCWYYLRSFALIYLCLFMGQGLASLLPITIPGSLLGMLILFFMLSTQAVPARWLKPGCHLFIRYMALLFVPISVGIMKYYDQLISHLGPIVVSCLVSSIVTMLVVAYLSNYLHQQKTAGSKEELR